MQLLPPAGFVQGGPWFNSSATVVLFSQLACLLPVGILNLCIYVSYLVALRLFQSCACKTALQAKLTSTIDVAYILNVAYINCHCSVTNQSVLFLYSQDICPFKSSFWSDILQIKLDIIY